MLTRFLHGKCRNVVDDPVEIFLANGSDVGIGGWVHKVDGVGHALFTGKLDCVEIVAQGAAQRKAIAFHTLE